MYVCPCIWNIFYSILFYSVDSIRKIESRMMEISPFSWAQLSGCFHIFSSEGIIRSSFRNMFFWSAGLWTKSSNWVIHKKNMVLYLAQLVALDRINSFYIKKFLSVLFRMRKLIRPTFWRSVIMEWRSIIQVTWYSHLWTSGRESMTITAS
jgi:hypothetical protein